jgi:drug/metabolite transporter (DMT)-like permease
MTVGQPPGVNRQSEVVRRYLLAMLTVLIWSTASVAGALAVGRYPNSKITQVFALQPISTWSRTLCATLFFAACVFLLTSVFHVVRGPKLGLRELTRAAGLGPILCALLVPSYLTCYYQGIMLGSPIVAHAIIYLWPCILFGLEVLARPKQASQASGSDLRALRGLALAFGGAILLAISNHGGEGALIQATWTNAAYAVLAAVLIAVLFFSVTRVVQSGPQFLAGRSFSYFVGCASSCAILAISTLRGPHDSFELPEKAEIVFGFWMGAVVLALGHALWTAALGHVATTGSRDRAEIIGISYFTPALSALILRLFFGEAVDGYMLAGLLLITIANLYIESNIDSLDTTEFLALTSSIVVLAILVVPPMTSDSTSTILSAGSAFFAILAGFQLAYIRSTNDRLKEKLVHCDSALSAQWAGGECKNVELADALGRALVDFAVDPTDATQQQTLWRHAESLRETTRAGKEGAPMRGIATLTAVSDALFLADSLGGKRHTWLTWLLGGLLAAVLVLFRGTTQQDLVLTAGLSVAALTICHQLNNTSRHGICDDIHSLSKIQSHRGLLGLQYYFPAFARSTKRIVPVALISLTVAFAAMLRLGLGPTEATRKPSVSQAKAAHELAR